LTKTNFDLGVKREIGTVNWTGLFTLYLKEVKRFSNVFLQTITAPMVTTLLFVLFFLLPLTEVRDLKEFLLLHS
jgi:ABC-2 type transport system permease protein